MKNSNFYPVFIAILLLLFSSCRKDVSSARPMETGFQVADTSLSAVTSSDQTEEDQAISSRVISNGKLMAKLRVLTHNVYGLKECDCDLRAKQFGMQVARALPKYDIVGVQEYYSTPDGDFKTCDAKYLSNAIWSTGRYRNSNNYYRFYPEVRWQFDGGVGIFTMHPIKKFDHWQWNNDVQPRYKAAEGFILARIEIPNAKITVDAYIVHLNSGGGNRERRKKQLQQLASKISTLSSKSGNPVIVMGDFNIGGPPSYAGNAGYQDIMNILKSPQDLWMTAHPKSNGFTYDCQNNTVAKSSGCRGQERIDYIFAITNSAFTNSRYVIKVANPNDVKVVNWHVPAVRDHRTNPANPVNRNSFNISDHFGLEALIEIREK
jgi:endonuclease/exonuclease/phosphatase family metal-dependent hydrolase